MVARIQTTPESARPSPAEIDRTLLWTPSRQSIESSKMYAFQEWLRRERGVETEGYEELHRFSIERGAEFWRAVWDYFDVVAAQEPEDIVVDAPMPGPTRFPGAVLNFAENMLRQARITPDQVAVIGEHESLSTRTLTWRELESEVASLAAALRGLGVVKGDRVAAVLPNIPETIIALLATASIGAVWSVVNTDYGVNGVADRFAQIEPKVLFTVDGYDFGGQRRDMTTTVPELRGVLPTVEHVVMVDQFADKLVAGNAGEALRYTELVTAAAEPHYEQLDFDHPLWVLYSSGTTGKPKGLVHSHGGITIDKYKENGLHFDLGPDDTVYFAVSTTWAVWNMMLHSMLVGSTVVTYDGSPVHGGPARNFQIVADNRVTLACFGAAVLAMIEKSGAVPKDEFDLSALRCIISGGSPLPNRTWKWVYEAVKSDVRLVSESGGTDVAGVILGSNPYDPGYIGELMGPHLGLAAETWDAVGDRVYGEVGELVITAPSPAMPIMLWGDDGSRYHSAYFDVYPAVWRHGDWATQLPSGQYIIHGRSDSTINRGGIRMGSADITSVVDAVPGVVESMVIGAELENGDYYMPLFVVPAEGSRVDGSVRDRIVNAIRTVLSPRYVPDDVIEAPAVPRNRTGKLLEIPIKRIYQGDDPAVINRETAEDPSVLDWYIDHAARFRSGLS